MNNLNRLKMELNNRKYMSDEQYIQFLYENNLDESEEYNKETDQRALLITVLDVLQAVANDTDLMRSITSEFVTESAAARYINQRIQAVKERISELSFEIDENPFSLMFTR